MSDIVERLRSFRSLSWFVHTNDKYEISLRDANAIVTCGIEAADEIDRLNALLAEARDAALEDAAKVAEEAASQTAIVCHQEVERALAAEALAAAIRTLKGKT